MSCSHARAARRRARRADPISPRCQVCIKHAGEFADRIWDRDGVRPIIVIAAELADGAFLVRSAPIDETLSELEQISPALARYARHAERLRQLAAADGVILGVPLVGLPCAGAYGRRGRFLADEDLYELERIALSGCSIGTAGDA